MNDSSRELINLILYPTLTHLPYIRLFPILRMPMEVVMQDMAPLPHPSNSSLGDCKVFGDTPPPNFSVGNNQGHFRLFRA